MRRKEVRIALATGRHVDGKEAGEGHYSIYVLNHLSGRTMPLAETELGDGSMGGLRRTVRV